VKRALVLGGGGIVGVAWETGLLAGLMAAGVDVRDADLVVGTSAGAIVGASVAHGRDPREAQAPRRARPAAPLDRAGINAEDAAKVFALWSSFDEMTQPRAAQVGALALAARIAPDESWMEGLASEDGGRWPERPLLVCATECESGLRRVFERTSGVELARALAASCCVPGLRSPVAVDGVRCMDGQVASGTSADLAERIGPDIVLVIAPIGWAGQGIHRSAARQIAEEARTLETGGASLRLVQPDESAREHMRSLMDAAEADAASAAGEVHGRVLARELASWWRL
jgi:NTE family protein